MKRAAVFGSLAALALTAASLSSATPDSRRESRSIVREQLSGRAHAAKDDRIDSPLLQVIRGGRRAHALAAAMQLSRPGSGHVAAVLELRRDSSAAVASARRLGATVVARGVRRVEVNVPPDRLRALARIDGVAWVRAPVRYVADAVGGEEVAAAGAGAWHAAGFTGRGVRVAIIDSGFVGLARRISDGEIRGNVVRADYCGGLFNTRTDHGTAVAEIVSEMAPEAQLILICADSDVSISSAVAFARVQGASIISHSRNSFYGRGDGTGPDAVPAATARASGMLWVNSAGNYAQRHWSGSFTSADGDRWHDFAPGDEANSTDLGPGATVCASLRWDAWPSTAQDYDLSLIVTSPTGASTVVAESETRQGGTQPPYENVCYSNLHESTIRIGAAIWNANTTATPRLDLFMVGAGRLDYQDPVTSLGTPADSASSFTVAAACWATSELEPYSSQGPTLDGRVKPDITGPDGISSATYGAGAGCNGFSGTSAAAPAVAGAAALVKQAFPSYTPAQIQQFLDSRAVDFGTPGTDNLSGSGRLALGAVPVVLPVPIVTYPAPSAVDVASRSATLIGSVNPNGSATQYRFEWGSTAGYSSATAWFDLAAATTASTVSARATNLVAGATIHFRIVARSGNGTANGEDQTFATPAIRDTAAPRVSARAAQGRLGKEVRLRVDVSDDSNRSHVRVWALVGSRRIASWDDGAFHANGTYSVVWHTSLRAPTSARFCVVANDRAGNVSARTCAPITLRR